MYILRAGASTKGNMVENSNHELKQDLNEKQNQMRMYHLITLIYSLQMQNPNKQLKFND